MRKLHPDDYETWVQGLSDRELLGLYLQYCGQSEEPYNPDENTLKLANIIWFETYKRELI